MMIPMFVLFILVATPVIYFIKNVLRSNYSNLYTIIVIALISVFTHPIIALIFACFVSIYEISELLRPAPAELLVEGRESMADSTRKS
jgi:MFS superfamily sulfate permease-like transporter